MLAVKIPGLDSKALAPALEQLVLDSVESEPQPPTIRELLAETGIALALVFVAVVLLVATAIAVRVRFRVGAGFTVPTQLVLMPMLFALPVGYVPLVGMAGCVLARLV